MASIHRLFDRDLVIQRLKVTTGNKRTFQSTATVEGHVQELDKEARQKLGITEGRIWEAWADLEEDIREGDRVIVTVGSSERTFLVTESQPKDYGVNSHLQLMLLEENE